MSIPPGTITHQKFEGCSCGGFVDIDGDQASVLAACELFRKLHRREIQTCDNYFGTDETMYRWHCECCKVSGPAVADERDAKQQLADHVGVAHTYR